MAAGAAVGGVIALAGLGAQVFHECLPPIIGLFASSSLFFTGVLTCVFMQKRAQPPSKAIGEMALPTGKQQERVTYTTHSSETDMKLPDKGHALQVAEQQAI